MKQTLLSRLILAGLAGAAMSAAQAGQIQASSVSIAREVITSDTQAVTAPSIAYRFFGDVDARSQAQTFQIQFTLAQGTWNTLPTNIARAISMSDGVSGTVQEQSAVAPAATNAAYQVMATGLSSDSKTMWATISVASSVNALVKQPIFSLNVTNNNFGAGSVAVVVADRATVMGLATVVGDLVADYTASGICEAVKTLAVSFKHYVALTSPSAIATDATATADEHTRGGSTNAATLMTFPTNLKAVVTAATGGVGLVAGGNQTFVINGAGTAFVDANNALLGTVALAQNAVGYDSNLLNQYLMAPGISGATTAVSKAGLVEVNTVKVTVAATQGFVVGGTLALNTAANCAGGTRVGTTGTVGILAGNAAGPIDLVVPNGNGAGLVGGAGGVFGAAGTNTLFVCYTNPGTVTIPSSVFSAVARVVKASAGAGFNEQDNICKGNYISFGGGLKIDVRNYASSAETSGYTSVLRFINNSDSAPADVWAQFVHQNGKLGNFAKIADIPVRGVVNMTAGQIDAKLAAGSAPAATVIANNGPAGPMNQGATATTTNTAPRLRISSTTGKSLRVQNYLFNAATGQILEGSGQQGVDFEVNANRAPGSEGQYQDQDANSGLNLTP